MRYDLFILKGRAAIVTSGNRGTGRVAAGFLAGAGADIVIFDIRDAAKAVNAIVTEHSVRSVAVKTDVTKPDEIATRQF